MRSAQLANTTGHDNTALGNLALTANSTGNTNLALGSGAGRKLTTGSNNIAIANDGMAGESGTIRIGSKANQTRTFIAGISGAPLGGAQPVVVNSSGRLGVEPAPSASAPSIANTVEQLTEKLERQQHQIERLREQVKGG